MSGDTRGEESRLGTLPVPLGQRTWSPWVAGAVCATAAIATWSFVVGGFVAYYLGAREGTAAMIAGALIGQLVVTLAQVPPTTKHGVETMATTKPQFGVRGSYVTLLVQYLTLIGWNLVLMIFFGRATASVLAETGVIAAGDTSWVGPVASVIGVVVVLFAVVRGARILRFLGPVVAVMVLVIGAWMIVTLLREHGLSEIAAAPAIEPFESRLTNYTVGVELLLVSTLSWWAYMGGMFRMVSSAGRAILPSMLSLGAGWAIIGLISLYSALVLGEPDPTVWMLEIGGTTAGIVALAFVAFANIGSTVVGAYAAALAVGQVPAIERRTSWLARVILVLAPMPVVLIAFPTLFFDNIGTLMAFIGVMIAPICGIQIVDWFLLGRSRTFDVPSLYRHDQRSAYWYLHGFNIPAFVALAFGSLTYLLMLDPISYVPRVEAFKYLTASLPSVFVGGAVYFIITKVQHALRPAAAGADAMSFDEREEVGTEDAAPVGLAERR
jgi:nucleobase:cation symporter-1, NCS1 family